MPKPRFYSLAASLLFALSAPGLPAQPASGNPPSGINLSVLDNILTSDGGKPLPATLANVTERVRTQTGVNFVLEPGVGRIVVNDVTLRGADLPAFAKAVQILTSGAVVCESVEEKLWALQWLEPPPARTVEVFNLGPYFQSQAAGGKSSPAPAPPFALDWTPGDGGPSVVQVFTLRYARAEDVARAVMPFAVFDGGSVQPDGRSRTVVVTVPGKRMEGIGKFIAQLDQPPAAMDPAEMAEQVEFIGGMVRQALGALGLQANAGAPPEFQFHPATRTLVVIGGPQALEVTRRIVAVLPGQVSVAVYRQAADDVRTVEIAGPVARESRRAPGAGVRPPGPGSAVPPAADAVYNDSGEGRYVTPPAYLRGESPQTVREPTWEARYVTPPAYLRGTIREPSADAVPVNPPVASPSPGGQ